MAEPEQTPADADQVAEAAEIAEPSDATEVAEVEPVEAEAEIAAEPKPKLIADPLLLAATDIARSALTEITDAQMIGELVGHEAHEDHVLSLFFESLHPGYVGWSWTATLSRLPEDQLVNVLEVELLPGADAVVAPDWVPWSERLAQYRDTQAKMAVDEAELAELAAAELSEEDDVDPEDDLMENDYSDFDDEIDGVDLDEDEDDDAVTAEGVSNNSTGEDSDDTDSDDDLDEDESDDDDESDDSNEEDSEDSDDEEESDDEE